jgi:hypothetical protein
MLIIPHQVIVGFSLTAYHTLILFILHYLIVHDVRRTNVVNVIDDGLLAFIRTRFAGAFEDVVCCWVGSGEMAGGRGVVERKLFPGPNCVRE